MNCGRFMPGKGQASVRFGMNCGRFMPGKGQADRPASTNRGGFVPGIFWAGAVGGLIKGII